MKITRGPVVGPVDWGVWVSYWYVEKIIIHKRTTVFESGHGEQTQPLEGGS